MPLILLLIVDMHVMSSHKVFIFLVFNIVNFIIIICLLAINNADNSCFFAL